MATSATHRVTTSMTSALFGATEGRTCEVTKSYWRNGEGWFTLVDTATGETFDSPDVFWTEA